jgi:hypothetical protein
MFMPEVGHGLTLRIVKLGVERRCGVLDGVHAFDSLIERAILKGRSLS